ncbi:hypothetical protein D0Z00_001934 [Geotrichum galactomycetum]|uniref:Uncharacterized protein n=1 Tax=Geotrichum galactomycetum TaxID=27317 RepID=A0ACB6V5G6_9ASCO|nr:hypothetical protein D0Z00_001934 [Geotrichum candidum]
MLAANIRAKRSTKKSKRKLVKRVSSEEEDHSSTAFISDVAASVPPSVKEEDILPEATPVVVPVSVTPPATEEPAAKWTIMETTLFQQLIMSYGTDFTKIAAALKQKRSVAAVREYFERVGPERGWIKLAASVDDKIRRGLPVALPPKHVQHHVSHQQPQVETSTNKRKRGPEESSTVSATTRSQPPRKVSVAAVEKKSKEDGDSVIVKLSMPQGVVAAAAAAAAKQAVAEATDVKEKEEVPVAKPEPVVAKPKTADASTSVSSVPDAAVVVAPESIKSVVLEVFESKLPSTFVEPAAALKVAPVPDTKLVVKTSPVQVAESIVSKPIVSVPEPKPASSVSTLHVSGKPAPVSVPVAVVTSSSVSSSPLYAYSHSQGHKVGSSSAAVDAVFNAAIAAGVGAGPGASLIASETGSQHLPPLPKLHQYHSQPQQQPQHQPMMTPLPPLTVGTAKTVPPMKQMQSSVLTSVSVPTPTGILEADESMAAAAAALGSLANVSFVRPRQAPQYAPTQQPYPHNLQSSQLPIQQKQQPPPVQQQYHAPTSLSELLKFSLVSDQATSSTLNPLGGIGGGSGSIGASGSITGGISGDNAQVSGSTQPSAGFDPTHLGLTRESSERFQARSHQQQQQSQQRR